MASTVFIIETGGLLKVTVHCECCNISEKVQDTDVINTDH